MTNETFCKKNDNFRKIEIILGERMFYLHTIKFYFYDVF